MQKKIIAIVDDEPDIINLVSLNLQKAGFETVCFELAEGLYGYLDQKIPDLIILDLMLPDSDGFDVCKTLKKDEHFSLIPIIMLTAKSDEIDRVLGLEFGAEDYVIKPFSPRELTARVKTVLRRSAPDTESSNLLKIGPDMKLDTNKYQLVLKEEAIDLTKSEFGILQLLADKPGWVFSRNQILDHLWGNDKIVVDRTIDVHIRHLRQKMGELGNCIKNVRGLGYKLEI
jgi:two-component system phosphate regulon response regulator PhoB/two-component system alkaline phosphatase synthesis response regulator PhoP